MIIPAAFYGGKHGGERGERKGKGKRYRTLFYILKAGHIGLWLPSGLTQKKLAPDTTPLTWTKGAEQGLSSWDKIPFFIACSLIYPRLYLSISVLCVSMYILENSYSHFITAIKKVSKDVVIYNLATTKGQLFPYL